jgi:hypothetical protein
MAAQIVDQEVSTSDIIRQDLEKGGFTKEEERFLSGLKSLVEQKKAIVLRYNNTVFVGLQQGEGTLEVHMYTIDSPRMIGNAMKQAIKDIPQAGVNKLVGETDNYKLISMMQSMKLPIEVDKKGKNFAWTMELK